MGGYFLNSEYLPLKAVLLCKPFFELSGAYNTKRALHKKRIDYLILNKEIQVIAGTYKKLGIRVHFMDPGWISGTDKRCAFNIMFARDIFFMTAKGGILSSMAAIVRRDETKYAQRSLKRLGVPVRQVFRDNATFEGADALWVNPRLVAVGVGNRTNESGFRQLKEVLKRDGVKCARLPAPRGTLHLLGTIQLINKNLALTRSGVDPRIEGFLKENKIKFVEIPEGNEVKNKQAFNFVTVAPKTVIMPALCPRTKILLRGHGVKVAAEVPITQLVNGGGGLACATGVLARA
ncbi:MAG: arginine deiminase family protein [Candidatus Omnitrophica bacterium]|nr:arginine deiminase family protein [Candidatus Omnitrophota bacterium]MDD5553485.1 arginine deiminase family protein [Candidatus Omnitrophota bacterium]